MVVERFLDSPYVKKHAFFILFLSIVYVFVAYGVAYFFFYDSLSLAAIFTLTVLLIPSLYHITSLEERVERKQGLKHFLRNHRPIFKIYFFAFLGIMIGFLLIGSVFGTNSLFSYQLDFLTKQKSVGPTAISRFAGSSYSPVFMDVIGLFSQNLEVVLIAFALSVFYGAGAVFLIIFNASLFSAFVFYLINTADKTVGLVNLVHFVPEIAGFLLAGMAGAILSVAIINEKVSGRYFKNVMKNIVLIFVAAIVLVFVAAVLEIFVSGAVIHSLVSS